MNPALNLADMLDPSQIRLSGLREDLQLQVAPRGLDGAPHWHLYDPVRNRFFRIGWLEFEILSRWQRGISVAQLAASARAETPLQLTIEDVLGVLQFLEGNELLQTHSAQQRTSLLNRAKAHQLSIWQWFLHNYLFFRVPLIQPNAFIEHTLPYLRFIFQPAFFLWMGALGLLGVWRVLDQWSSFSATFLYFFSWQGLALYGIALGVSKLIHEFAHAYTAKYYGLRVPTMGVAFMMMWPLLYTDTSEGWKLGARRARLAIGGAGVIAELLLAGIAALAWSVLPDGPWKSAAYVLAAVTWISTLAINLNPFMRFDGYYLTMDAIDMPNLHQRSFAFGRWQLRRWLLGVEDPIPETEFEARRRWLIAYAYATWIYRLVLFTGIAAAVYYFFFKLAGVILFAVEIGWFVVRPIWNEGLAWYKIRARWQGKRVALSASLFALFLLLLAVPWRTEVSAPGIAQAVQHTRLFPSMAAQVQQVFVKEGQQVGAGDVLFQLQAPDLAWQAQAQQARITGLQAQLERAVSNPALIERVPLWQQELAQAQANLQALQEEMARLQIKAPHAGVIRDVESGVFVGAWVGPQRMLARVIDNRQTHAQIYVNENDIEGIKMGAPATILTQRADSSALSATVESIDRTASHVLPHVMLASSHGGPLATRNGPRGELFANEALYRVTLKLADGQSMPDQMHLVQAQIAGERNSLLAQGMRRVLGVLIRESGF